MQPFKNLGGWGKGTPLCNFNLKLKISHFSFSQCKYFAILWSIQHCKLSLDTNHDMTLYASSVCGREALLWSIYPTAPLFEPYPYLLGPRRKTIHWQSKLIESLFLELGIETLVGQGHLRKRKHVGAEAVRFGPHTRRSCEKGQEG